MLWMLQGVFMRQQNAKAARTVFAQTWRSSTRKITQIRHLHVGLRGLKYTTRRKSLYCGERCRKFVENVHSTWLKSVDNCYLSEYDVEEAPGMLAIGSPVGLVRRFWYGSRYHRTSLLRLCERARMAEAQRANALLQRMLSYALVWRLCDQVLQKQRWPQSALLNEERYRYAAPLLLYVS